MTEERTTLLSARMALVPPPTPPKPPAFTECVFHPHVLTYTVIRFFLYLSTYK